MSVSWARRLCIRDRVEYDKLIDRQIERAAITSISGFAKPYQEASKVLTV